MTLANVSWRLKAGLAVVLLLVLVRFVLIPLSDWQDETIQKVQILQKAVAQKKGLIGNEKEINDLLEKARSSFENTAKFFVMDFSDAQSLQLVTQKEVERLAAASGVQIKRTNWLYPSEGEIVQAPIKINCVASPAQMMHFLSAIESGEHFFAVDMLKIISKGNTSSISAEIDVSAYGLRKES